MPTGFLPALCSVSLYAASIYLVYTQLLISLKETSVFIRVLMTCPNSWNVYEYTMLGSPQN